MNPSIDQSKLINIASLRQQIIANLQSQHSQRHAQLIETLTVNENAWWLLGTLGCHLCDEAEKILGLYQIAEPIDYIVLDIADFDEDLMGQFATTIPVILTANQRLDCPFSIMDLQGLSSD